MAEKHRKPRITPRRARSLERLVHLVTGLALVAYVYLTPPPDSPLTAGIRWLVPMVVSSGLAMWLWPRIRRYLRRQRVGA
jgi:hypothetical protein